MIKLTRLRRDDITMKPTTGVDESKNSEYKKLEGREPSVVGGSVSLGKIQENQWKIAIKKYNNSQT